MKFEQQVAVMRGPYSALFTPFDAAGAVNYDTLAKIAEFQLAHGIRGFFVAGTTGEGLLLTFDERVAVIRRSTESRTRSSSERAASCQWWNRA